MRTISVLTLVALLAGGMLAFVCLAQLVRSGAAQAFDERLLLALRDPADPSALLGPLWLQVLGRDVTALGSVTILTLLVTIVTGYLLLTHKTQAALFLVLSASGGAALSSLLKAVYGRPRPELVPQDIYAYSASFPSGHAMMSTVIFMTLAVLLANSARQRRVKLYCVLVATLIALLVGVSRVYLGVHWPTDVLAGWTAGAIWTLLGWQTLRWVRPEMKGPQA